MATGWTPERKARQTKLIQHWRPWEKSTGPKTQVGKEKISQNAYKGGLETTSRTGASPAGAAAAFGSVKRESGRLILRAGSPRSAQSRH